MVRTKKRKLAVGWIGLSVALCFTSQRAEAQAGFRQQSGGRALGGASTGFGGQSGFGGGGGGGVAQIQADLQALNESAGQVDPNFGQARPRQFVGADAADFVDIYGGFGANTGGNAMGNRRGAGGAAARNFRGMEPAQRGRVPIRTRVRIGFRRQPTLDPRYAQRTQERYQRISDRLQSPVPVQVDTVDRTATVTGTVASEADRRLWVRLTRLEPGVSRVVDQLVVAPLHTQPGEVPPN